ncbi:MAG: nitroreductase/quinone reductase family protein [Ilumatobacteraceae bacterium]
MPSNATLKAMNIAHRIILRVTGGRKGWEAGNMPVLELTTTGRKTGKPRSVMLTSPMQEGESIVVVASRGGDDVHPAWYLNLVANPRVQVKFKGGPTKTMTARTATAAERARLWPIVEQKYKGYAGYQQRTDREIPLILLD